MNQLVPTISAKDISTSISRVAHKITEDYQGKNVVFVGVLKGAFIFLSDLVREVNLNSIEVDFLQVSSYAYGTVSSEKVFLKKDIDIEIRDKDVIIVEDIVDTGLTLSFIVSHLGLNSPKSIKICTMIDKKARRQVDLDVDYVCCKVDQGFLVGYGLDYAEKYRNLPEIYCMEI